MRIIRTLVAPALIGIAALSSSCNQAEMDKMKNDNESLKAEISSLNAESAEKDKTISDFFTDFTEIEANLATIKEK